MAKKHPVRKQSTSGLTSGRKILYWIVYCWRKLKHFLSETLRGWVEKLLLLLLLVIISVSTFMIIESGYPTKEGSAGLVAIISAVIGVVLTGGVTVVLLRNQAKNEEKKDIKVRIFTKKMDVYHHFLAHLETLIETKSFTEGDMKQLLMQLSYVAMHADPRNVQQVYQHMKELVDVLTAERDSSGLSDNKDNGYYENLSASVFDVVHALRTDLYGDDLDEHTQIESFDSLIESIGDAKELPPVRELITNLDAGKLVKEFHKRLEEELKRRLILPGEWTMRINDSQNIDFRFRHQSWTGENDYVGLMFDGIAASEVYFFVSLDCPDPRKCYRYMRSVWGGRFNDDMWRMSIDAPYRNWRFDAEGLAAVENCDPELIGYLAGNLARFAEFSHYYAFVSRLTKMIQLPDKSPCHRWIYQNICLVHEYEEYDLVVDTFIEEGGWTITLFSRGGSTEHVGRILPAADFPSCSGYRTRFFRIEGLGADNLPQVAAKSRELITLVEKYLAKLEAQNKSKRR